MEAKPNVTIGENGQVIYHDRETHLISEPATHGAENLIKIPDYIYWILAELIVEDIEYHPYDPEDRYEVEVEHFDYDTGILYVCRFRGSFDVWWDHTPATHLDPLEDDITITGVYIQKLDIWTYVDDEEIPNDFMDVSDIRRKIEGMKF